MLTTTLVIDKNLHVEMWFTTVILPPRRCYQHDGVKISVSELENSGDEVVKTAVAEPSRPDTQSDC